MDPEAQAQFQELMESLKKAMMETFFKDMYNQIQNMSPEDMARMKQMVKDLNQMLQEKMAGGQPNFDEFMQQYGDLFGDNPPQSLEELIQQMQAQMSQMQNLLDSMPGEMQPTTAATCSATRSATRTCSRSCLNCRRTWNTCSRCGTCATSTPSAATRSSTSNEAMNLMERMQGMDELERQLERTQYGGDIDEIDAEKLRELLGDEAAETLEQLKQFLEILENAGYIRKQGQHLGADAARHTQDRPEGAGRDLLTAEEGQLRQARRASERGTGGERADETKKYEFGDPFHLHLEKTIFNSFYREAARTAAGCRKCTLHPDDFEVYRSETLTQTATVMMLDLSWSMALRGSFQAAKKVALALNNLIRSQFSRDSLYIIGFSAYARELKAEQLPYVRWDESVLGTNMHHALDAGAEPAGEAQGRHAGRSS